MATSVYGNDGFSKVENTSTQPSSLLNTIEAAAAPLLNTGSVTAAGSVTLSDAQLKASLLSPGLLVAPSGASATTDLVVGADTAARAAALQTLFGLTGAGDYKLMYFHTVTEIASDINLKNSSGTHVSVDVTLGATSADTQILYEATGLTGSVNTGVAVVAVVADNVTSGSEVIRFQIVNQCIANP